MQYRGFKIETNVETVQVGYAPLRHNKKTHTLTHRTRNGNSVIVTDSEGYARSFSSLKKATEWVDSYHQ